LFGRERKKERKKERKHLRKLMTSINHRGYLCTLTKYYAQEFIFFPVLSGGTL
jgi:hypothetical protein